MVGLGKYNAIPGFRDTGPIVLSRSEEISPSLFADHGFYAFPEGPASICSSSPR